MLCKIAKIGSQQTEYQLAAAAATVNTALSASQTDEGKSIHKRIIII